MHTRWIVMTTIPCFLLLAIPAFSGGSPSLDSGQKALVRPLEEQVRIPGETDEYFLKRPRPIRVARDGHIFVADDGQLLEFDTEGRFIRDLYRQGEGPGELQNIEDFGFQGERIVIHQTYPNKIVVLDRDGGTAADYRPAQQTSRLLAIRPDHLVMARSSFKQDKQKSEGVVDMEWKLFKLFSDGRCQDLEVRFDTQMYGKKIETVFIANNITDLLGVPLSPPLLALTHSSSYQIDLFDTEDHRVVKNFARAYPRVKAGTKGGMKRGEGGMTFSVPRKFHNDVLRLFVHRGRLWALTSTLDPERGWLVDVFNEDGDVQDQFHLPLHKEMTREEISRVALTVTDEAVLTVITGPDDLPEVVSYTILR